MFDVDSENGNMIIRQGDSGRYIVSGLPTDKPDYVLYYQAQDENRKDIGDPLLVNCNGASTVAIIFTGSYTDVYEVPKGEPYIDYFFAFKLCSPSANTEVTLTLGNKQQTDPNILRVYPKIVEGI